MKKILIVLTLTVIITLILGVNNWNSRLEAESQNAKIFNEQQQAKKEEEYNNFNLLYQRLLDGDVEKIKLVGDSITAGVGADGFNIPEDSQIILEDGDEIHKEADFSSQSWANNFRNYINRFFPDVQFNNAGIGGKSVKWANQHREDWISDEDVVLVMFGANDRWDSDNIDDFKENLSDFLKYVDANSNQMIVMSPPPALTDGENERFNFGMEEVDQAVKEVVEDNNYEFISNYEAVINYAEDKDIKLDKLLQDTGSHPLNSGYKVIWDHIKSELTLENKNKL